MTEPVFGPIGYEEWHRTHYKHMHHHLLQFGLIELCLGGAALPNGAHGV
jgi:hypothetical protein